MTFFELLTVLAAFGGLAVAAGSLIVATLSFRRSNEVNKAQSRLQEKQEELINIQLDLHKQELDSSPTTNSENQRADIRVTLEGSVDQAKFVIRNWGYNTAKNIDIYIDPINGKSSPLLKSEQEQMLPVPFLSPGGDCKLLAAISFSTGYAFDVKWSWDEIDGAHRSRESRMSL